MTTVTISPARSPLMEILAIFDSEVAASVSCRREPENNWPIAPHYEMKKAVGPYYGKETGQKTGA